MSCWSARTAIEAANIGSLVLCGVAAWPPFPCTTAVNLLDPAIIGSGFEPIVPTGINGQICKPLSITQISLFEF
ncbi:iaa-amino acid hydrolase ilr1-like 1 [Nicotiana attenuata]|uniref:Iaa-amino acid hydrolase ilr1-like 1 n=1 Tax=Nicotiana attenuata TaxID=49451 RepID=A0A314KZN2_NICAT|nr:iaa-amino acid hydrolase ilr1-like 1 [Nicotiana attenuata]